MKINLNRLKLWKKVILGFGTLFLLVTVTFFVWTRFIYVADKVKLQQFFEQNKNFLIINNHRQYWEIVSKNSTCGTTNCVATGFIFYPGAKIDPRAYFYKLDFLVNGSESNTKLFITKPPFHLAFFGINQADKIIKNNPEIKNWILGGHSLGGAMSCEYVKSHTGKIKILVLLGAYCGSDMSDLDLKVVSINGSLDGVLPLEKVSNNRKNLPQNNVGFVVDGMNHAQVGNYGDQSGDNFARKSDDVVKKEITAIFKTEIIGN